MKPDSRDIARLVSLPQMLRHLGWRVRHRNRADCGVCKGNSKGTVAFTEQLWKCHRCGEGGDVFSLVRAVHRCQFPAALRYVAEFGGVGLGDFNRYNFQREIEARRQQRERIDRAANILAQFERALRIEYRDAIHKCDSVLNAPGPWSEAHWLRAHAASVLDEYLLPAYTLLSWGAMSERTRYVLAEERTRADTAAAVRIAGGVRTDDDHWMDLLA